MRRVSKNAYAEIYFRGCNPGCVETSDGFVMIDSPQQPIDAMRWREFMEGRAPIRYLINTEWHGDHIWGNAYFPHVEVIGQERLKEEFEKRVFTPMNGETVDAIQARMQKSDPDSAWLVGHPDYPPCNPPTRTFKSALTLELGAHRFECLHMPGHTEAQTSVYVPSEGVVFTGDNVFCKCKTWLQEADPWQWLAALDAIAALDVETIIPGHGEPCGKDYLARQREIIEAWIDNVDRLVAAGVSEDDAAAQDPLARMRALDPYPMGQRLEPMEARLAEMNVRRIHRLITQRRGG